MSGVIFKAATFCSAVYPEDYTLQALLDHLNTKKAVQIHGAMTRSVGFLPMLDTANDDAFNRLGPFLAFDYVVMTRKPSDKVVLLHCDNKKRKQGLPDIGIKDEFFKLHYESMVAELLETTLTSTKRTPVILNLETGLAIIGTAKFADIREINGALQKLVKFSVNMPDDCTEQLTSLIGTDPATVSAEIETTSSVTMKAKTGARASWSNQDLMKAEIIDAVNSGKSVCSIGLERTSYTFSLNQDGTLSKIKRKQEAKEEAPPEPVAAISDIENIGGGTDANLDEKEDKSELIASDVLAQAGDFMEIFQEVQLFLQGGRAG